MLNRPIYKKDEWTVRYKDSWDSCRHLLKQVKTDYPPFYPVGTQKMKRASEAECRG